MKFPLSSLLLLSGLVSASETPMDYAQGWQLETPGESALYQLDLPYEVLAVSQHDLADIAIFDAAGQPLTWWRERVDIPLTRQEQRVSLAVYPDGELTTDQQTGEIRIISEPDKTEVRIAPQSSAAVPEPRPQTDAYIVLVPEDAPLLAELELHWRGDGSSRVEEIRIRASDTLLNWRTAGGGAIARLQGNGDVFVQRRVPLQVADAAFYRIEWGAMPADWQLDAVYGISVAVTRIPAMEWRQFAPVRDEQALYIASAALLRPQRMNLSLTADNTVLAASTETRVATDAPWRRADQGVFYRLQGTDSILHNPPHRLDGSAMRELRLAVSTGQADSVRTIELGWTPPRIMFVASGQKPYVLAVGAAQPGAAAAKPALGFAEDALTPGIARLGAPVTLGGEPALQARLQISWKTVLLWSLLLTGTIMVLLMVWRLARSARQD